jgi:hypothetical protein
VSRYWSKKSCPSNVTRGVPTFISASQRYQNRTKQKRNKKTIGFSSPFQSKRMLFYFNVNDIFV